MAYSIIVMFRGDLHLLIVGKKVAQTEGTYKMVLT